MEIDGFYSKNLNEFIHVSSPSLSDDGNFNYNIDKNTKYIILIYIFIYMNIFKDYIKLSNIKIRNITSQGRNIYNI